MPVPCPCCKASNDSGPACRRCKADLTLLFALEADRAAWMEHARGLVAAGRTDDAQAALERAQQLRRGDDATKLKAVSKLLARDFTGALAAYLERTPAP